MESEPSNQDETKYKSLFHEASLTIEPSQEWFANLKEETDKSDSKVQQINPSQLSSGRRTYFAAVAAAIIIVGGLFFWSQLVSDSEPLETASTNSSTATSQQSQATSQQLTEPDKPKTDLPEDIQVWAFDDGSDVVIEGSNVLVEQDVNVGSLTVAAGASLYFSPETSATLASSGNVVINGKLVMKPQTSAVLHQIEFTDVNIENFVGDESDIGLWVKGEGVLDLQGHTKTGWTNLKDSVAEGQSTVEVVNETEVQGWAAGDVVVLTPTAPPGQDNINTDNAELANFDQVGYLKTGFHETTIVSIEGTAITLAEGPPQDHPLVAGRFGAELINLTRNVVIGSSDPQGRAHTNISSSSPQSIRHVRFDQMGSGYKEELGSGNSRLIQKEDRHALQFANSADGSEGSTIEGVAISNSGNKSFVFNNSHGISVSEAVVYNSLGEAYFGTDNSTSNNLNISRSIAAGVGSDGFYLNGGSGVSLTNSVAVGIKTSSDQAGLALAANFGEWQLSNIVSHNNYAPGAINKQRNDSAPNVERLVSYHNHRGCLAVLTGTPINEDSIECIDNLASR